MKEGPFLTGSVFSGLALFLVVIGVIVWRNKRRTHRRSPGYILDDRDQQIDPTPEHSVLIKHEGPMHFEIPHENLQLLRCPADDSNLDFDVFVSYSSLDRDFVKTVLYAELSTTHSVCIDFKDFEAGLYIGDNIFNSIFRSRKTLLVVTRNFLKGVWTFFEMQIAQGRLAQGHDVLIPVIVDDIPFDELPKPLQHYRQTKTYLEYFNEDVKPHFWDRLRSALGPSLRELKENAPTTPEEDSAVRDFV
ncbi:hypothetical protein QZH41_013864 [Actinostola sp. cb2023]|nr:hypothetical protein QZH41_013864 [Actinostola sp. cb2023]